MTDDKPLYDPVLISAIRQDIQQKPMGYDVTKLSIANNLVEKIEKLLVGKATRSTVVNSRGEVKHRIIIEYDWQQQEKNS